MRTDTPYPTVESSTTTFGRPSVRTHRALAEDAPDVIRVNDGGIWSRVPAPTGLRVSCASGSLWITQAGSDGDTIVRHGTSFTTAARGKVVVQAMGDASFRFDDRA